MVTLLIFIAVLGLLVVVHEFGHFITARKSGMKVHEFGIGFPPRIFGLYRDPKTKKIVWVKGRGDFKKTVAGDEIKEEEYPDTVYSLNWLPLGGFCKIKGENGEMENEPDSFGYQKAWKKIVVLIAGVTMNFILAAILLGIGFMIGLPVDLSAGQDDKMVIVEKPGIIVQQVQADSPAEEAGIQFGDKIVKINGEDVESSSVMIEKVSDKADQEIIVTIQRGDEVKEIAVVPEAEIEGESAKIGVMLADAAIVRFPWYIAIYKGFVAASIGLLNIFIAFYFLIKNLILGQGLIFDVAGPVGIASIVGQSARLGINYLINVTAMISLSLVAINILPIPALDGGRIVFVLIEKITGKKVPLKYEQLAHTIGFVLLMGLVIVVTFRDVIGLF